MEARGQDLFLLACFSEPFGIHFCLVEDTLPPDPLQRKPVAAINMIVRLSSFGVLHQHRHEKCQGTFGISILQPAFACKVGESLQPQEMVILHSLTVLWQARTLLNARSLDAEMLTKGGASKLSLISHSCLEYSHLACGYFRTRTRVFNEQMLDCMRQVPMKVVLNSFRM